MNGDVGTTPTSSGDRTAEPTKRGRLTRQAIGIRVFSSASDATRSRRPTDAILLVLAIVGALVLSLYAPGPTAIDTAATDLVAQLPDLAGWFWEVTYDLLIVWSLGAARRDPVRARTEAAVPVRGGRRGARGWVSRSSSATPAARTCPRACRASSTPSRRRSTWRRVIAIATAVIVTASPDLSRPLRQVGRWLIGIGVVSGVALGCRAPDRGRGRVPDRVRRPPRWCISSSARPEDG